jgi:hypothetical protein
LYIAILNNEGALFRDEDKFDEAIARFTFLKEIYYEKYGPNDTRTIGNVVETSKIPKTNCSPVF